MKLLLTTKLLPVTVNHDAKYGFMSLDPLSPMLDGLTDDEVMEAFYDCFSHKLWQKKIESAIDSCYEEVFSDLNHHLGTNLTVTNITYHNERNDMVSDSIYYDVEVSDEDARKMLALVAPYKGELYEEFSNYFDQVGDWKSRDGFYSFMATSYARWIDRLSMQVIWNDEDQIEEIRSIEEDDGDRVREWVQLLWFLMDYYGVGFFDDNGIVEYWWQDAHGNGYLDPLECLNEDDYPEQVEVIENWIENERSFQGF